MQLLDDDGLIREPCSDRWGKRPIDNPARMRFLLWRRWIWLLLIPIAGFVFFANDSDELTNDYGFTPWWLW